jgi:NAD(P)-dependent dehydrogenase (short-subunit alcohol dehydrogenase family)
MMTKRMEGKVCLVTGCGSSGPGWGNGKAISVLLAREGARVFGCDIHLDAATETCDIIRKEGGQCQITRTDVTDSAAVKSLVQTCIEHYGRIDVLVNNVGISEVGGPVEYPEEKWQRMLDVNLTSMFLTCKHTLPYMERQNGGSIVNIGSIAGVRYTGVPYIAYYASKAGVLGLSRGVALQYAAQNIRSNVVMPGLMDTPMIVEPLKAIYSDLTEMRTHRNKQCPMGHMGDAWDIAEAVLYLASDAAKYVNGTELMIDGGISAKFN